MLTKTTPQKIMPEEVVFTSYVLPPGFPPGYAEHRRELGLSIGETCKNATCQHCLAYKQMLERE